MRLRDFLMLWMTGLIAPSAYRWGGFVSIDMIISAMPKIAGNVLTIALLCLALFILIIGLNWGYSTLKSVGYLTLHQ